jgi:hypothetical protein
LLAIYSELPATPKTAILLTEALIVSRCLCYQKPANQRTVAGFFMPTNRIMAIGFYLRCSDFLSNHSLASDSIHPELRLVNLTGAGNSPALTIS